MKDNTILALGAMICASIVAVALDGMLGAVVVGALCGGGLAASYHVVGGGSGE